MSKILGYKAFDEKFQCNPTGEKPFQYEVGKTYTESEKHMCSSGFHFCLNPFDILYFYDLATSRFAKVESDSKNIETDDSNIKSVTSEITIVKELSLHEFIQECIKFNADKDQKSNCINAVKNEFNIIVSEDDSQIAVAGFYNSKIAISGYSAIIAIPKDDIKIATAGSSTKIATSGGGTKIASSGHDTRIATTGGSANIAGVGNYSKISAMGDNSKLISTGCSSEIYSSGKNCVIAALGSNSCAKGKIGSLLILVEYDTWGKPINKFCEFIDGIIIKEDTFYALQNGKLTDPAII